MCSGINRACCMHSSQVWMKLKRAASTEAGRCLLPSLTQATALPSFFAFPVPSPLVTAAVSNMYSLVQVRVSNGGARLKTESVANDEGLANWCAYCRMRVSRPYFELDALSFQLWVFLLMGRRSLKHDERCGLWMVSRESGHRLLGAHGVWCWHRFLH
jgi:hypothetical protein